MRPGDIRGWKKTNRAMRDYMIGVNKRLRSKLARDNAFAEGSTAQRAIDGYDADTIGPIEKIKWFEDQMSPLQRPEKEKSRKLHCRDLDRNQNPPFRLGNKLRAHLVHPGRLCELAFKLTSRICGGH